mmetsp:Transcript_27948/g.80037  ORF Transcript_27948/g.80037 Transcript_27948/m.80037 type:complete len:253 (+) Transcript_27948:619-1377(+)
MNSVTMHSEGGLRGPEPPEDSWSISAAPMKLTSRGCLNAWRFCTSFRNSSSCAGDTTPSAMCNFLMAHSSPLYFPRYTAPKPPEPSTWPNSSLLLSRSSSFTFAASIAISAAPPTFFREAGVVGLAGASDGSGFGDGAGGEAAADDGCAAVAGGAREPAACAASAAAGLVRGGGTYEATAEAAAATGCGDGEAMDAVGGSSIALLFGTHLSESELRNRTFSHHCPSIKYLTLTMSAFTCATFPGSQEPALLL